MKLACQRRFASGLPEKAKVVIVGGGIIGNSVAYHLAKEGWGDDVVLLEKGVLTCGTTWHAAGLIGQLRATSQEMELSKMGAEVFRRLLEETGQDTGFKQNGSVTLARTKDRTTLLKRNLARAQMFNIPSAMLTPEEAKEKLPMIDPKVFDSALWLPNDGVASPTDATMAFAKGARQGGVKIHERVEVTGFVKEKGLIRAVETNKGTIACDYVVNCGGLWAHKIGHMAGVNVPLHPCEHFYAVTDTVEGVTGSMPVVRDPDMCSYYREWGGGLVVGAFELDAKPCFVNGPPDDFEFSLLPDDIDHFWPIMEGAFEAVPSLVDTPIKTMLNGPESFTPDNQYILGDAPEVPNFWVAAGMNSSGIASSSGAGWALAKWLVNAQPPFDMSAVDIKRFGAFAGSQQFVRTRSSEVLGMHYKIHYPRLELVKGRPLRTTPLYNQLKEKGGVFGSKFGWERVNWFNTEEKSAPADEYTFGRPAWLDIVNDEYIHTTTNGSVFEVSSFAKFTVAGRDAEAFCNYIFGGNMSVKVGTVVYTAMLDERGGYVSDVTVTRVGEEEYYVVSPTTHATKDLKHMQKHAGLKGFAVGVVDVSSQYGVLSVQGPKVDAALQPLTRHDLSTIKPNESVMLDIGDYWVRASRVSYVGEKGLELHIPIEAHQGVYNTVMNNNGGVLKDAGYYCIEAMRVANGYRAMGHEIGADDSPLEVGTGFAVDFEKTDGVAGTILAEKKAAGVKAMKYRVVSIKMEQHPTAMLWGGETILHNGTTVGYITSGTFIPIFNANAGLALIKQQDPSETLNASFISSGKWEVNIAGEYFPITLSLKPPVKME
eukprot:TRINITY_DN4180_c1_g2_i1.p1 TRINITY_DN4180_c1_g2~~TRINITY_DN4180_c1_g2_i1.p1  ORF type:complete len:824 (+),score=317.91 TRINITY_DN4180_c1_g2_i1:121-2592(+)